MILQLAHTYPASDCLLYEYVINNYSYMHASMLILTTSLNLSRNNHVRPSCIDNKPCMVDYLHEE
jgi:hypothetical protein